MANSKSAKKYILISRKNQIRNKKYKTSLKTILKTAYTSFESIGDATEKNLFNTCKIIDKIASKGIIKKTTAARKKSRLVKAFNKAKTKTA